MECNRIQERIAWGKDLDESVQRHILDCPACSRVMEDFTKLQAALEAHFDTEVREGFADRVMARIAAQFAEDAESSRPEGFLVRAQEILALVRFRLAYLWGVILLAFGLLVPSAI